MALTLGDRELRPLTADEVLRMVEVGILDEDERVELLGGVLTAMSPKSPAHETIKTRLISWLWPGVAASQYLVRVEAPIIVPDRTSLPEPDIAVVEPRDYTTRHPACALLVVEVAVSSLVTDTTIKPALYAAAGVPEMWVVDVGAQRLRIFRDPHIGGYATKQIVGSDAIAQPGDVEVGPVGLATLFAGL